MSKSELKRLAIQRAAAQSLAEGANSNAELAANRGHVWETWDDGEVNIMAWNPADPHNGPRCVKCGSGYCHHCQDGPSEDCTAANVDFSGSTPLYGGESAGK